MANLQAIFFGMFEDTLESRDHARSLVAFLQDNGYSDEWRVYVVRDGFVGYVHQDDVRRFLADGVRGWEPTYVATVDAVQ